MDIINLECGHRCRAQPVEASAYSLEASDRVPERFRADAAADLTVEVEETVGQEQEKKTERSSMELTVDFSKQDVAEVIFHSFLPHF